VPNTTFPKPLNITVKPFRMYNHKFKSLLSTDQSFHHDLKQIVDLAKRDKVIYENLAEPFLDSVGEDNDVALLSTTIISSKESDMCMICVILLYIKYIQLAAALLILKNTTQISAATLPSFHYSTESPVIQSTILSVATIHSNFIEYNDYIFVLLPTFFLIFIIWRKLNQYKPPLVFLEISNATHCAAVPVLYLPTCSRNCQFNQGQLPISVDISLRLRSKLHINWNNFEICTSSSSVPLSLPQSITLFPVTALAFSRILSKTNPYVVQLYVLHRNFCIPIDIIEKNPSAPQPTDESKQFNSTQPLLYPNLKP